MPPPRLRTAAPAPAQWAGCRAAGSGSGRPGRPRGARAAAGPPPPPPPPHRGARRGAAGRGRRSVPGGGGRRSGTAGGGRRRSRAWPSRCRWIPPVSSGNRAPGPGGAPLPPPAPCGSSVSVSLMVTPIRSPNPPCAMAVSTPRTSAAGTAPTWTPSTSRGLKSHAYIHSVQFSHHVFLNLHTLKFYCLPDNYEIIDSSLEDITYVLKPTFTAQQITNLDKQAKLSRAYDGTTYLPGIVGLNNIKANDYANAVLQALSNVPPLRNYFLEEENYKSIQRPPGDIMFLLVQRFGELMRKLWNPRNFKAHVSPHEMLQAVVLCSKKNFQITKQGDGVDFLSWFLNALHSALGGTKKKKKTIVTDVFQGSMRIFTKKLPHPDLPAEEKAQLLQNTEYQEMMVESTFMYLTLDLPTAPLYKDEKEQLIIPQVPLFSILAKFNGATEKEYKTYKENFLKRFQLTKLPPYLIFCIKRFTKNNFFVEKNPTIVNFPITNVDLREYLSEEVQAAHTNTTYDLIANIVHDGKPSEGSYRIHVLHHGTGKWYELQDLQVTDILPQMITLSEAYIQIWKRREEDETNQQGA
ncbi:U4/U6.U5 tri-snRNP-associated protein 2 isoform X2 [Aquila chrysaetos chrysaetos]|uniref:U4/U6.U5 tri-snRNP-associated protein 2 isoform X2 n=1 Tax=Aquila chrysaetos chrysaetos TaxID=223781 RepID=UPI0011767D15|nr:U4/U6.U5 tri-snRNP-associated protein 2 isoform X2 [Aquila chrysaetos chrysaetos]